MTESMQSTVVYIENKELQSSGTAYKWAYCRITYTTLFVKCWISIYFWEKCLLWEQLTLNSTTKTLSAISNKAEAWEQKRPPLNGRRVQRQEALYDHAARCSKAVGQAKQGSWMRWESIEKETHLEWKRPTTHLLISAYWMEPEMQVALGQRFISHLRSQ